MAKRRLSNRQKERIRAIQERRRQKMELKAVSAQDQADDAHLHGLVITRHGQNLVIDDGSGELVHCLFRQNIGQVVCGDRVVWQPTDDGQGVVTAVLERESALIRPNFSGEERALAANITQLVIVIAPQPVPSRYLVDQYLVAAESIGIRALIALNKRDLFNAEDEASFDLDFEHYPAADYPIVKISARFEHGLDPLIARLRNQTSILVGQSGVGKSSLINTLLPDLDITTGRLSAASSQGCHTTSATTLYTLPEGGSLIDSPGVRSFRFGEITRSELEMGFREFQPFLGRCRFSNCTHGTEPGCVLRQAVAEKRIAASRLENYLHMVSGLENSR